eukprot:Gregarina_sp_Pseudo_9__5616@NODE_772_length_2234_cov_57_841002_g727_i0_p2_GENE_NODE_772_length_2234_cov_57_841002_g727_i0NODE_772_length_2234_cov_57_841002_g727_i0_p2_ORF_typecomplete_len241_score41_44Ras/PF00071_22/5_4e54Roc/PF08477_13/6_2e25Arf/PF00025_21/4_7e16Gtr1_RagA/PF04670_12/3_3e07SRPRB/PF09439_10/1_7e06GTP_EFTU/PF00009_27/6_3e06MMR_HSR1/PF01926_23/0_00017FeoB_N/PF02421_18/0_00046AAA_22/PF13401_6/0_0017TniB/PF05621_11/0_014AAA_5/PF07728_14/0_24ANAPC1/PF12859_7/0_16_NODE_772_length_2234_
MPAVAGDDYDYLYKIILVGDATVGKTHLLSRYTRGTLPRTPQPTVGVEFATHTVPLAVGGTVKAQIWDTAGQERYRSITAAHYRRAVGALLVFDVTKMQTFKNASHWLEDLRAYAEPDIVTFLVGNKVDLVEGNPHEREVPFEVAAAFANNNGLFFSEVSAVTSFNVKKVFERLLQEIYNQKTKTLEAAGAISARKSTREMPLVDMYNSQEGGSAFTAGFLLGDADNREAKEERGCCGQG